MGGCLLWVFCSVYVCVCVCVCVCGERKIAEHFVLFFFFGGIVINKRNHTVTAVNNGILQ